MSNLLKYTVPTWNDHVYGYNDSVLDIRTSDSVIRIFGILDRNVDNEDLMGQILNNGSVTISLQNLYIFADGANLNLKLVYDAWRNMETQHNAPHIVLGIYNHQTYCARIDSWTNPETMTLSRIVLGVEKNRLKYLTKTPEDSSLLAFSMLNNIMQGWIWRNNEEYRFNMPSKDILAKLRFNLDPVPVNDQGFSFDNWTMGSI